MRLAFAGPSRRPTGLVAVAIALTATVARPAAGPAPFRRTEARPACAAYDALRTPFFGDLHVHTRFSADASIFGTRVGPRDVYDYARGAAIPVVDAGEQPTRTSQLDRPIDFAAVTDHAEFYGEVRYCLADGSPVADERLCQLLGVVETDEDSQFGTTVSWLFPAGIPNPPASHAFCNEPGIDCDASAASVWQEIQAAAEEAYDRTDACTFTPFVGYEHTPSLLGRHMHRNVIFRNATVPPFAYSYLETHAGGTPQGLWTAIEDHCLTAGTDCDALLIPHNPNLSGGRQWEDPTDAADAFRRQRLEPLAEIHQQKGNSECRFDRLLRLGTGTDDELCTFEQLLRPHEGPDAQIVPVTAYPRRNLVRNTLVDGLGLEQSLGVNPFRLGFVGGTDTHNGTAGQVDEIGWQGGQGRDDGSAANQISGQLRTNPGGLTAAWAEENSRDALFAAMRRRETYATSGTRPVVRFFAGPLENVTCDDPQLVERAYADGTPMGGEFGPVRGTDSPRFLAWAAKDAGSANRPGVDLQRLQIVKGWVDANGTPHERVFDVAGDANNGASVDRATCAPTGPGAAELCTTWEDPAFDPAQRAFYYLRVLENPSCRWSTRVCRDAGIDPFADDCATQASAVGPAFADCCRSTATDAFFEPVVQERAWSSPVWYRPEGIAALRARLRLRGVRSTLSVQATLGGTPAGLDLARDGLTVRIGDDASLWQATVPPNRFRRRGARTVLFKDRRQGVRRLSVRRDRSGAVHVALQATRIDLRHVPTEPRMVSVELESGTVRVGQHRRWAVDRDELRTGAR